MKKLPILTILFLFSCSDTTEILKEKSELDRCKDANLSQIQNINIERLKVSPEILRLPVKIDIDYIKSVLSGLEDEKLKKEIIDMLSNKDTAKEYLLFIQERGLLSEDIIVNLDEVISISIVMDEKIMDLKDFLAFYSNETTQTQLEEIISSTIRFADLDEIAKNICWSQGIY